MRRRIVLIHKNIVMFQGKLRKNHQQGQWGGNAFAFGSIYLSNRQIDSIYPSIHHLSVSTSFFYSYIISALDAEIYKVVPLRLRRKSHCEERHTTVPAERQ